MSFVLFRGLFFFLAFRFLQFISLTVPFRVSAFISLFVRPHVLLCAFAVPCWSPLTRFLCNDGLVVSSHYCLRALLLQALLMSSEVPSGVSPAAGSGGKHGLRILCRWLF